LSRMTVTKVYTKFDNPKKGIPQTTDLLEPPKKPGTSDPVHLKNCESQFVTSESRKLTFKRTQSQRGEFIPRQIIFLFCSPLRSNRIKKVH
jgi:hypothetical protein